MDSGLCLNHGALHIPFTTSCAAGLAGPYSSFKPSSLSLVSKPSSYRTLQLQRSFKSRVICALNNPTPPSANYDKDNVKKIVRVVTGASVVLACVIGVVNCKYNFSPTAIAGVQNTPSTQEGDTSVLSDPKDVLESLLRVGRPPVTQKSTFWPSPTPKQLEFTETPTPEDRKKLKTAVASLVQSGKCDEAERQLKDLYEKTKGGEPKRDVEMELVLVLIFQEKYKEALECNCLGDDSGIKSDGRVSFYKAIIHTMLGQKDDAETCWNTFVSSFDSFPRTEDMAPNVFTPKIGRERR